MISTLVGLLGGLANWPVTLIIGMVVGAFLSTIWPKQFHFLKLVLVHPWRLVHGHVICPECFGERPDGFCAVCLAQNLSANTPTGFVSLRFVRKGWDWQGWHQRQPIAYVPTIQDGREVRVPLWRIPERFRS